MENNALICPHCKAAIQDGESCVVCPVCGTPHHKACWDANGGCDSEGCAARVTAPTMPAEPEIPAEPQAPAVPQAPVAPQAPAMNQPATNGTVCSVCQAPMAEGQLFCSNCGTQRAPAKPTCPYCGADVIPGQTFCAGCGQRLEAPAAPAPQPQQKKKNLTWLWILLGAVVLIVALLIGIGSCDTDSSGSSGSGSSSGSSEIGSSSGISSYTLKSKLQATRWWSKDDDYPSLQLFLEFEDDEIVYSAYAGSVGMTELARIPYTVYDSDTLLIYGAKIEVKFYDSGISFTPSFTNDDDYSIWVAYDR